MLLSCKKIKFFAFILIVAESAIAQKYEVDSTRIKEVVVEWNEAHNKLDEDVFDELHAPSVLFYTLYLPKKVCLEKKRSLLNDQPFEQRLVSDLQLLFYEEGIVYCGFTKEVITAKGKKSYPSYLLLKRIGDQYCISGESDLMTDRDQMFHLSLGPQIPLSQLSPISLSKKTSRQSRTVYWVLALLGLVSVGAVVVYFVYGQQSNKEAVATMLSQESDTTSQHQAVDIESLLAKLTSPRKVRPTQKGNRNNPLVKGHTFEEFVVNRFREKSDYFKWMDATSDKGVQGYYPESNLNPDLQYEYRVGGVAYPFGVECKFRSITTGSIHITKDGQLERYRRFSIEKKMPVFIVLGLGGNPHQPVHLYVIPLAEVRPIMDRSQLDAYKAQPSFSFDVAQMRLF